jgi:hypothetical protein
MQGQNTNTHYKIERLSSDNLHSLISLYKATFRISVSLSYLLKKYDTQGFGVSFIGFIAFDITSNKPAGYYGVFPIKVKYGNQIVLAAQSGDTMTHPSHQGKGLFTKLAQMTYDLAKQVGISFVFGFPNKNSSHGFINKLNWKHYSDVNNYTITFRKIPFDKLAKKFPFFAKFYFRFVSAKIANVVVEKMLENSLASYNSEKGFVIHDLSFYNYKKYHSYFTIKISNIVCVIKVDGRLWVGDIEFCDEQTFFNVLSNIEELAKSLGCSSVQFSVAENTVIDSRLKSKYNLTSKNPVGFIDLAGDVNPANFAYQAIDFDTY